VSDRFHTIVIGAGSGGLTVAVGTPVAYLALLLASFYLNGASWMYLAALLEKRNAGAAARGELTTVTMPAGLVEGAETVVLYTLFLLFPGALVPLFGLMAVLVLFTVGQRVAWAARRRRACFARRAARPRSASPTRPSPRWSAPTVRRRRRSSTSSVPRG